MKKILFLLLIWLLPLFAFGSVNECLTDVYFGNGILTKEKNATANTALLRNAIIDQYGSLSETKKHIGKVKEAYNDTFGFGQDIFESGLQITNLQGYVDWFANKLPGYKQSVHEANIEAQVDKYEASIRDGHKVLVVAHSQGNLFAQEAYETLGERSEYQDNWLQKYFEAVSIASPDRFTDIKPDMPKPKRIGWDNDMVAVGGGSTLKECKIRKVKWEDAHPGVQAPKPKYNYVTKNT